MALSQPSEAHFPDPRDLDDDNTARSPEKKELGVPRRDSVATADTEISLPLATEAEAKEWSQYTYSRRPWRREVTDFKNIVEARYRGSGTTGDPYIIQWLDHDPENPKNYPFWYKISLTASLSSLLLCVSMASSAYSGAAREIIAEFHCSEEVFLLGLSMMVLGFAVGPLFFAPLGETMGRRNPEVVAMAFYTLWTAVCASSQNIQSLIVFRFLCGTIGSVAFNLPSGHIADMYEAEQRGVALSVYSAAPFFGPSLGPLVGGFLAAAAGWRWLMGFLALYGAVHAVFIALVVPETYAPVLLRRRAQLLSRVTGKVYVTNLDFNHPVPALGQKIKVAMIRPWALLFGEPIVLLLSIYTAVAYGTLYIFFAAFPIVFQDGYGWNPGQGGLAFLGIPPGIVAGVGILMYENRRYTRIHNATGGFAPPETRLPAAIVGGVFMVAGLAWFAATADPSIHFIVPILAGFPFGLGFILVFMASVNYLVDSYVIYSATVMAASSILRSTFGAVFPLFTISMYRNLGVRWASAVPAFIALACLPFPILFYIHGARIRRRCKYSAEAAAMLDSLRSDLERQSSRASVAHEDPIVVEDGEKPPSPGGRQSASREAL